MKLAWLVWRDEESETPEIHCSEPYERYHFRVVAIVYAEIEK
jgi:hypothetical protein